MRKKMLNLWNTLINYVVYRLFNTGMSLPSIRHTPSRIITSHILIMTDFFPQ